MQTNMLLITHNLKCFNSAIYAVKELIAMQKVDGYDHLIDTLLMAHYGIADIVEEMEQSQIEAQIRGMHRRAEHT